MRADPRRDRQRDVHWEQHVERVRGIEEATLESGEPGDAAQLVGIPQGEETVYELAVRDLVEGIVVEDDVPEAGAFAAGENDPKAPERHDQGDQNQHSE